MTVIRHADITGPLQMIAAPKGEPFVTPDDYRVAAQAARNRNRLAVRARNAGNFKAATAHQSYANWLIARARMWRKEWENAE